MGTERDRGVATAAATPWLDEDSYQLAQSDGPPCEITCRPGWDKLCAEGTHPARFASIKSCGCRTLICKQALNRILSSLVHDVALECQTCHELHIGIANWYPL